MRNNVDEAKVTAALHVIMQQITPLNLHEAMMVVSAVVGAVCYGDDITRAQYGERYRLVRAILDKYMATAIEDFDSISNDAKKKASYGHPSGTA